MLWLFNRGNTLANSYKFEMINRIIVKGKVEVEKYTNDERLFIRVLFQFILVVVFLMKLRNRFSSSLMKT